MNPRKPHPLLDLLTAPHITACEDSGGDLLFRCDWSVDGGSTVSDRVVDAASAQNLDRVAATWNSFVLARHGYYRGIAYVRRRAPTETTCVGCDAPLDTPWVLSVTYGRFDQPTAHPVHDAACAKKVAHAMPPDKATARDPASVARVLPLLQATPCAVGSLDATQVDFIAQERPRVRFAPAHAEDLVARWNAFLFGWHPVPWCLVRPAAPEERACARCGGAPIVPGWIYESHRAPHCGPGCGEATHREYEGVFGHLAALRDREIRAAELRCDAAETAVQAVLRRRLDGATGPALRAFVDAGEDPARVREALRVAGIDLDTD